MIRKLIFAAVAATAVFVVGCGQNIPEKDAKSQVKQGGMNPDGSKGDKGAEAKEPEN